MKQLIDQFGRKHTCLRIAVTDRCNLRCHYCMPPEGVVWKPKEAILSYEEIVRVATVASGMGVDKIRLTGGEPLVRQDVEQLAEQLAHISGIKTVGMTTNGVLLAGKVEALRAAGLNSLNISLDSLQQSRFAEITRRDDWHKVISSIQAAASCGFDAVKLNCVVMAGCNDDEILDFVDFVADRELNVRFIEYMPFPNNLWEKQRVVLFAEMMKTIESRYRLIPLPKATGAAARDFAIAGHCGKVGFITSVSESFCSQCNRLRLTADGAIKSCLFSRQEVSLREVIRGGGTDDDLREAMYCAVMQKGYAHLPADELAVIENRTMVEIGG